MSKRTEERERQLRKVEAERDDLKREVAEVSGANGMVCMTLAETRAALHRVHEDRALAWTRTARLEQLLVAQGDAIVDLTEQNATLKAALEAMAVEDLDARVAT